MRYAVGLLSLFITLGMAPLELAQNGRDPTPTPSKPKPAAARVSDGHQDLARSGAKAHVKPRTIDSQTNDHVLSPEEHQAIPYRPCIDARGWKNGRLVCADQQEKVHLENGHEVEGPYSPR
jgi:hypothetical protein